jgi:cytochrome c-type biogenesis protein CcmH
VSALAGLLTALALLIETPLADPSQEARAQALMRELRCVTCENEPISQSSGMLAEDMRAKVRDMVGQGQSDAAIRDWFASRYGDFVLLRPKSEGIAGWLLWLAPLGLLGLGAGGVMLARRGGQKPGVIEAVAPETLQD